MPILAMLAMICFTQLKTSAQQSPEGRVIKKATITESDGDFGFAEFDQKGNAVFNFNCGMNGPITMVFASEYDSLNREVSSFWAHSNLGFSFSEYVYSDNKVYYYKYQVADDSLVDCTREELNQLNTWKKFLQSPKVKLLKEGKRILTHIKEMDEQGHVLKEMYLSENGDTTSMNEYEYDSLGRENVFRLGVIGDDEWRWDIYSEYDAQSNLVLSYRMEPTATGHEKSEVHTYTYDKDNNLVKEDYYNRGVFQNQSVYIYDKEGRKKETLFYEGERDKLDHRTRYTYKGEAILITKECDYRNGEKVVSKRVWEFY